MPAALKVLASSQLAATTATTVYTVPASSSVKIASIAITNTSSSAAVAVTVAVISSSGTNDGTHDVLRAYSLAAGDAISHRDVLSMLDGAMLDTGTTIVVTAGTGATLNYLVTGAVIS